MRVIVAGTRTITDKAPVYKAIRIAKYAGIEFDEVVSGTADGPDTIAADAAKKGGIDVKEFPADWEKHGKAAGPIRNRKMAEYADALVACWNGESDGTRNMIKEARCAGLEVFVYIHRGQT